MTLLWSRLKAQASWTWAVLFTIHGILLIALFRNGFHPYSSLRRWQEATFILEVYLPLVLALFLAPLPALDRSEGAAELHLSYRRPAFLQLLGHVALPLLLWALVAGATGWSIDQYYAELPLADLLTVLLYPAGALGGAALAGGAIARHPIGGVVVVGLWWGLDLLYPAKLNRLCYLFLQYQPTDLDGALMQQRMLWVGLGALLLTLLLAGRRERWVRERAA
ncbi:MAG TPA: hypothetical protein VK191_12805 [Symbiobacteriaceae bacterium]|nr:hypothetical protein [Symbiobacteriaceae bacterium]